MERIRHKKRSLDDSLSDASSTSSYVLVTDRKEDKNSDNNDESSYYTQSFESNMTDPDEEETEDQEFEEIPCSSVDSSYEQMREEIMRKCSNEFKFILGIDYTISNKTNGSSSFGGKCLHDLASVNPYQKVIISLAETVETLTGNDTIIQSFGFGDSKVKDKDVFSLNPEKICRNFLDVFDLYIQTTQRIRLGNPSDFSAIINAAITIVNETNKFHVLIIITDGQVSEVNSTKGAIVRASNHALSIVVIGIGDGPWALMEEWDSFENFKDFGNVGERMFDNFRFVNYHKVVNEAKNPDVEVACAVMQKITRQLQFVHDIGYLDI